VSFCKTNPIFLNSSRGLINHSPRTTQLIFLRTSALAPFQIVRRERLASARCATSIGASTCSSKCRRRRTPPSTYSPFKMTRNR
jgi:hypothetical protein